MVGGYLWKNPNVTTAPPPVSSRFAAKGLLINVTGISEATGLLARGAVFRDIRIIVGK